MVCGLDLISGTFGFSCRLEALVVFTVGGTLLVDTVAMNQAKSDGYAGQLKGGKHSE